MGCSARRWSILAVTMLTGVAGAAGWFWQPVGAVASYFPACFQPGPPRLRLFPPRGRAVVVALPAELPANMRAIAFASDGGAIDRSAGIYKIETRPPRYSLVPGSMGMGEASCLAVSKERGTITVEGWSWSDDHRGVFEIDPFAASRTALPPGSPSECGGSGGILSPDGRRAVTAGKGTLGLVDVRSGNVQPIRGTNAGTRCVWSPDSRWVACVQKGTIALIDADTASQARSLGSSGDGPVVWSPDSRFILLRKSQIACAPTAYGESLEVVEVEVGKRSLVESAKCTITSGTLGWMDQGLAQ